VTSRGTPSAAAGSTFINDGDSNMAQKGAGGNPGAITTKGGDGASGSTGTGRGGGNNARGSKSASKKKDPDKTGDRNGGPGGG
jgi:hypothetical protein